MTSRNLFSKKLQFKENERTDLYQPLVYNCYIVDMSLRRKIFNRNIRMNSGQAINIIMRLSCELAFPKDMVIPYTEAF